MVLAVAKSMSSAEDSQRKKLRERMRDNPEQVIADYLQNELLAASAEQRVSNEVLRREHAEVTKASAVQEVEDRYRAELASARAQTRESVETEYDVREERLRQELLATQKERDQFKQQEGSTADRCASLESSLNAALQTLEQIGGEYRSLKTSYDALEQSRTAVPDSSESRASVDVAAYGSRDVLTVDASDVQAARTKLLDAMDAAVDARDLAVQERDKYAQRATEAEQQSTAAESRAREANTKLATKINECSVLEGARDDLRERVSGLEQLANERKAALDTAQASLRDKTEKYAALTRDYELVKEGRDRLHTEHEGVVRERDEARAALEEKNRGYTQLDEQYKKSQKELGDTRDERNALNAERDHLVTERDTQVERNANLEAEQRTRDERISTLERKVQEKEASYSSLLADAKREADERYEDFQRRTNGDLARLRIEVRDREQELTTVREDVARMTDEVADRTALYRSLDTLLRDVKVVTDAGDRVPLSLNTLSKELLGTHDEPRESTVLEDFVRGDPVRHNVGQAFAQLYALAAQLYYEGTRTERKKE